MDRDELIDYLEQLLNSATFSDYAPNGLQVEGKGEVNRICTAVSASYEVIKQAQSLSADALIVHHGYFWKGEPSVLVGMKKNRIAALMTADINLLAYHLPLDCHPTLGNNVLLAKCFHAQDVLSHSVRQTPNLLWSGDLSQPTSFTAYHASLKKHFGAQVQAVEAGDHAIQRIAWCSGGAQDFITDAAALGVDAYISGEVSERTYYQAKELGVHYFACGHHATERGGVQALGQHLAEHFGIEHVYIEVQNPF
jgi:dinuclear metal center YbgI/SA1388 family protein